MKRLFCLFLLSVSVTFAQQFSYDQLLQHWDYDTKAPLAIKEAGVQDRDGIKVHDISYAVPTGDSCPVARTEWRTRQRRPGRAAREMSLPRRDLRSLVHAGIGKTEPHGISR